MLIFPDVNIFIYALRADLPQHIQIKKWFDKTLAENEELAFSHHIFSSVIRIVTNPRIFKEPEKTTDAFKFCSKLLEYDNAKIISPGNDFWDIFYRVSKQTNARGDLIPDMFNAALAIEHGAVMVTTDKDYKKVKGLKVINPLA